MGADSGRGAQDLHDKGHERGGWARLTLADAGVIRNNMRDADTKRHEQKIELSQ